MVVGVTKVLLDVEEEIEEDGRDVGVEKSLVVIAVEGDVNQLCI